MPVSYFLVKMSDNANIRSLYLSENDQLSFINYFSQVNNRGTTYHILPWHSVALLSCDEDGSLVDLRNTKDFNMKRQPWLLMKVKLFYVENEIYCVFVSPQCDSMKGVLDMRQEQDPSKLKEYLCIHSKVTSELVTNWREIWSIDVDINRLPQIFNNYNQDKVKVCLGRGANKHTLVAVLQKNNITLLSVSYTHLTLPTTPYV